MSYEDIIETYLNGNKRVAVKAINESGWYDFATRVEYDDCLSTK